MSINSRGWGLGLCGAAQPRKIIWEWLDLSKGTLFIGIKKTTGWIFIIIGGMCTNTANTFMLKQHVIEF